MTEKNNVFSEMIPNKRANKEKLQTKLFTIELIIYNYIYENINNKKAEEPKKIIDKEKLNLEIPINPKKDQIHKMGEYFINVDDLKKLLIEKGYPITTSSIYILDENSINDSAVINERDIIDLTQINNDTIKLKLENYIDKKLIDDTFSNLKKCFIPKVNAELDQDNSLTLNNIKNNELNKRTRKIGEVVKIVYSQRKFFNGYYNDNGEKTKYNLEEASKKVGIKRKTLDDYLKQLRKARLLGFDFNKNKDESISFLRDFNEKHKNKKLKLNFDNNNNDIINNGIDDIDSKKENILELEEDNI